MDKLQSVSLQCHLTTWSLLVALTIPRNPSSIYNTVVLDGVLQSEVITFQLGIVYSLLLMVWEFAAKLYNKPGIKAAGTSAQ